MEQLNLTNENLAALVKAANEAEYEISGEAKAKEQYDLANAPVCYYRDGQWVSEEEFFEGFAVRDKGFFEE